MSKVNRRAVGISRSNSEGAILTHEGAPASIHLTPEQQLRRLVSSCFLWDDEFYVDGATIAEQIEKAAMAVEPAVLGRIAVETRNVAHLRHVPLLLLDILTYRAPDYAGAVAQCMRRADDPAELIALHLTRRDLLNKNRAKSIPASIRKGIELAMQTGRDFGRYGLAKYERGDALVKLRDVFRLVRPRPLNREQSDLWKMAIAGELEATDTWEHELMIGKDKRATFTRLLREDKLGYMALLRNLRNMERANVDRKLITDAIRARKGAARVLPFRYVAAARAVPTFEQAIDEALRNCVSEMRPLEGGTTVLVDVSHSMNAKLSEKSDLTRMDAAATLASVIPGDRRVFTFSTNIVEVAARVGMAGIEQIIGSQPHMNTYLGAACRAMDGLRQRTRRLIVITDEESHDEVRVPTHYERRYLINVASAQHGVSYGNPHLDEPEWSAHLDGFSENVIKFIRELEGE